MFITFSDAAVQFMWNKQKEYVAQEKLKTEIRKNEGTERKERRRRNHDDCCTASGYPPHWFTLPLLSCSYTSDTGKQVSLLSRGSSHT